MEHEDRVPSVQEERTSIVAWHPKPEEDEADEVPDALILGDVDVAGDFQMVRGAARRGDGKTSTFLFYTSGATSRVVHPDAVPEVTGEDRSIPRTPYEDFILSQIDGMRSVRDIHRASGLAPQEVVVTLLTLLDKGAVRIAGVGVPAVDEEKATLEGPAAEVFEEDGRLSADQLPDFDEEDELEATQAIEKASSDERPPIRGGSIREGELEDLPSVSDFEEIFDEVQDELGETSGRSVIDSPPISPGPPPPPRERSSLSDVWAPAEESDQLREADELVAEDGLASEEVTKAGIVPVSPEKVAPDRVDTKPPRTLEATPPPRALSPDPDGELSTQEDRSQETAKSPVAKEETPEPLPLDPAFLVEVPSSTVGVAPDPMELDDEEPVVAPVGPDKRSGSMNRRTESAKAKQRAALEAAMKRGPIHERVRGAEAKKSKKKKKKRPDPAALEVEESSPTLSPESRHQPQPVDSINMLKAQKLFDQALKDKAEGNLVSARMNMKLAMTFDATNELYAEAFDDLNKNPDARVTGSGPTGRSRARELYDAATEAENEGDVDRAVELLEQAISHSKQPAFLNRLGVILAMKKREYARAQQLVEQARDLAPDNATYEKNLHKILSMAATADVRQQEDQGKKGGFLGFLGRRK